MHHAGELKPEITSTSIAVETDFDFLSTEYRALFNASCATAFQAPLWMHAMHTSLAPALHAKAHTITLRNSADGTLLAVFPMVAQRVGGMSLLQPADFGVCDYNAPIASVPVLEMMAANTSIRDQLHKAMAIGDVLMFRKSRDDGFDLNRLLPRAKSSIAENAAYHCALDDDFEIWRRETLRKKATKELGRKQRQFATDFENVSSGYVKTAQEIEMALRFIRDSRVGRFQDDLLQNEIYFNFYRDFAVAAIADGEAECQVIYVDKEPAAALFGLTGDGNFHAVLIAADMQTMGKYSLGTQVIYQTIKLRHAKGDRVFDMGLGNSGYKSHFRAKKTGLKNFTQARTLTGAGAALIYHRAKPLKNAARRLLPNLH